MSMVKQGNALKSRELRYQPRPVLYGKTGWTRLDPENGTSLTVRTGGGDEFEIRTPAQSFPKYFHSNLRFTATTVTAPAGGNQHNFFADTIPIRRLRFENIAGQSLIDIDQVGMFLKAVSKPATKFDHYINSDLTRHDILTQSNDTTADNVLPWKIATAAAGSNTASVNYLEPLYVHQGGDGVNLAVDYELDLSSLKHSIFAIDKTLYFNQEMRLIIQFESSNFWGYRSTAGDPQTGIATLNSNINLTNIALYLAEEKDENIQNEIRQSVQQGRFNVLFDYVSPRVNAQLSGSRQTATAKISGADGIRLKRVYHTVKRSNDTDNRRFNIDNRADDKVQEYYTSMDDQRLTPFLIDTSDGLDWTIHKDLLHGSVILSSLMYRSNFVQIDDFTSFENEADSNQGDLNDLKLHGLDLSLERTYRFVGEVMRDENMDHYTFVVTQRMVSITPQGLLIS